MSASEKLINADLLKRARRIVKKVGLRPSRRHAVLALAMALEISEQHAYRIVSKLAGPVWQTKGIA